MKCPSCFSNNTRACWVVYEQGVREGANWISTSPLAQRCAPPVKKTLFPEVLETLLQLAVIPWSVYFFFLSADCTSKSGLWLDLLRCNMPLIKLTAITVGTFLVFWLPWTIRQIRYNRFVYPQALSKYNEKWICMRCGEFFVH